MNNRFEHGGNVHHLSQNPLTPLLDFSANINPLGLPQSVRQAIVANLDGVIHYPDPENRALKEMISRCYYAESDSVVMGNGAVELIYLLCHQVKPRRVMIPAPAFSEYERAALAAGAEICHHFLAAHDDFAIDAERLAADLAGCDMLFLGNPNNPTGNLLSKEEFSVILAAAKQQDTLIVVDESFIDFVSRAEEFTVKPWLADNDHLAVLHSLTKFYAIPGLRLGFALTNKNLSYSLHLSKDPWNVNSLAQAAGIAALGDTAYQKESRDFLDAEIASFTKEMSRFKKIKLYQPTVNFALANISRTGLSSSQLKEACLKEGILIRDCANYPGLSTDYVRFAIKAPMENQRLYQTLTKILGGERT